MTIAELALEAQLAGEKYFHYPCKVCGNTKRYVKGTACVHCLTTKNLKRYKTLPKNKKRKNAEQQKTWRENNPDKLKAYKKKHYPKERYRDRSSHARWVNMLHKAKINKCTVCKEWQTFKAYDSWLRSNPLWRVLEVDKDLLGRGKNHYSPETCILLPKDLNISLNAKSYYGLDKLKMWYDEIVHYPNSNKIRHALRRRIRKLEKLAR